MSRKEIFEAVKDQICIQKESSQLIVEEDSTLNTGEKSLDFDSLEIVNLIVEIEKKFDIIIDFDRLFVSVGDIVDEIESQLNT